MSTVTVQCRFSVKRIITTCEHCGSDTAEEPKSEGSTVDLSVRVSDEGRRFIQKEIKRRQVSGDSRASVASVVEDAVINKLRTVFAL